jgi:hypothetical protein
MLLPLLVSVLSPSHSPGVWCLSPYPTCYQESWVCSSPVHHCVPRAQAMHGHYQLHLCQGHTSFHSHNDSPIGKSQFAPFTGKADSEQLSTSSTTNLGNFRTGL